MWNDTEGSVQLRFVGLLVVGFEILHSKWSRGLERALLQRSNDTIHLRA